MTTAIVRSIVLLVALVAPAASQGAMGALSPESAYRQYIDALFRADPDHALEVIVGRPDQIDFIRTFISCLRASNIFRQKYISAYGQSEWDKFGQVESNTGVPAFSLPGKIPLSTYRELLKKKPVPSGRSYLVSQENGPMRIIQRDGQWYLQADSLGFEGHSPQYEILTAVLREYQTRIGAPGETAAGLRVAVKRALHRSGHW